MHSSTTMVMLAKVHIHIYLKKIHVNMKKKLDKTYIQILSL